MTKAKDPAQKRKPSTRKPIGEWQPNVRQMAVIHALTAFPYPTLKEAAITARVRYDTVRHWHTDPRFRVAIRDAYEADSIELRALLTRKIQAMGTSALAVKGELLSSPEAHVRNAAATWLLERLLGRATERFELSGPAGAPIETRGPLADASNEQLATLVGAVLEAKREQGE